MSDQPTYDSVMVQLRAYLDANCDLAAEKAFNVLLDDSIFIDCLAHLLRCLQAVICKVNFDQTDVHVFFTRVLRLLQRLLPNKMTPAFKGEKPPANSPAGKRMRLPTLRHTLTETWAKLLEKELPNDLVLETLIVLGDGQLDKMTDTARLLAPYIIVVFDPPPLNGPVSASVPLASWSRAVARSILKVIHLGALNFDRLYPRLYALLDEGLLVCPYADRFLVDLDVYLSSTHVPAGWLSAFAKRLTQLSLLGVAPSALLLPLLTVAANCLIRHPACRVLVDRRNAPVDPVTETNVTAGDPYSYHPNDLPGDGVNALKSSLWEVACLECHYHPEIASLGRRIRQIPATKDTEHLPDVKNQIDSGKQMQAAVKRTSKQCLSVLKLTNARLPTLPPLEGWTMPVEDAKTAV